MTKARFDHPFAVAVREQLRVRGHFASKVAAEMAKDGHPGPRADTIYRWLAGRTLPSSAKSVDFTLRVEQHFGLARYELTDLLPRDVRLYARNRAEMSYREVHTLAWHLPDDFDRRPRKDRTQILEWVRSTVFHQQTEYRRYVGEMRDKPFSLRFENIPLNYRPTTDPQKSRRSPLVRDAPQALQQEMQSLLAFRTSAFAPVGLERLGRWKSATAAHHAGNFSRFFGALSADPASPASGAGLPLEAMTFALCLSPELCDWYLNWRERRRGFYGTNEFSLLIAINGLLQPRTGWLYQSPGLAKALRPIDGFITPDQIADIASDWHGACLRMLGHVRGRTHDIKRVMRGHRDPAEPILPVLAAPKPADVYRRIEDEILKWKPSERTDPLGAAEATRDYLLVHIALKTGLRQRNLRELRLARPGQLGTKESDLEKMQAGEIRKRADTGAWELYVPLSAFKNAHSRFFGGKPLLVELGNSGRFAERMDLWVKRHRARLIGPAKDPSTMFVRKGRRQDDDVTMSIASMTHHWYRITRKYGIYNPYTKRGAVQGLLPHGPHNVRDVRATHVLKATGSYEIASYAIHDTAATIEKHYGRFLPGEKARKASDIVDMIWSDDKHVPRRSPR
ncbi:hypothetical protein [Aureimonas frigidaquae]|uniref:hypothetical protein n=1 Tax=Aureimonas frigidaquae TaxID=424757 RepID=UPI000B0664DC|nr:hypothetical protein [Aureimonas frigidaquae]